MYVCMCMYVNDRYFVFSTATLHYDIERNVGFSVGDYVTNLLSRGLASKPATTETHIRYDPLYFLTLISRIKSRYRRQRMQMRSLAI